MKLAILEKEINYIFTNKQYLITALKHSSKDIHKKNFENNERMEFLGDRVLGFVIAKFLYNNFPTQNEGYLAKALAYFTSKTVLCQKAKKINLINYIELQQNDSSDKIIADAFEAVIAAIYLDCHNMDTITTIILAIWREDMLNYNEVEIHSIFDPKSLLQIWTQKLKLGLPKYHLEKKEGEEHAPIFYVSLEITNYKKVIATGSNLKTAEKNVALQFIKENNINI